jgi:hypothetical protein
MEEIETRTSLRTITIEERKRFFEVRGRENLILVSPFLVARKRSSIVIVLELVLVLGAVGKASHLAPSSHDKPRRLTYFFHPDWDRTLNRYQALAGFSLGAYCFTEGE